jgi:hypothetical protein
MAHEVATKSLGVAGRCGGNAGSRTRGALSGSFTSLISEDKPFRSQLKDTVLLVPQSAREGTRHEETRMLLYLTLCRLVSGVCPVRFLNNTSSSS